MRDGPYACEWPFVVCGVAAGRRLLQWLSMVAATARTMVSKSPRCRAESRNYRRKWAWQIKMGGVVQELQAYIRFMAEACKRYEPHT